MFRTLAVILLSACATTGTATKPADGPGARGPRASEHLAAAREHDELARQSVMSPDLRHDATQSDPLVVPWDRTWSAKADHDRLAQIHRSAAAQLQAEYEEACGARPLAEVSVSPLQRYGVGGTPIKDGAVIYLTPEAGSGERLLADMRCHRAWMMLTPRGMDDCPLDLQNIEVAAHGDAEQIAVTITVRDPALVDELQRRAAVELEMSEHHLHAH